MKLEIYLSCWANEVELVGAVNAARHWGYDGVEGPPPADPDVRRDVAAEISKRDLPYIAEIATGGDYVPAPGMTVQHHLDDLERHLDERVSEFDPVIVNVLGGTDRWSFSESVDFFTHGIELGAQHGHQICWETHRSRPTFSPWNTRDLLQEIPEMLLNCDFSHWCAVCERLVLDEESEILALCAQRCRHLHARVGYAQGPQVSDPRDQSYNTEVEAHMNWWGILIHAAEARGAGKMTVTPEFGPDGYLQVLPHNHQPVADLHELNRWMAQNLAGNTRIPTR